MSDFFKNLIDQHRARRSMLPPLASARETGDRTLTEVEDFIWRASRGHDAWFNVTVAYRLRGHLDASALERTLSEIVRRHEALRTCFVVEQGQPRARVSAPVPVALTVEPLPPGDLLEVVARERDVERHRPFDLARGPLFRATLRPAAPDDHVLLCTTHHLVNDASSSRLFYRELIALYPAFAAGRPSPLPEPKLQYSDFARWQRAALASNSVKERLRAWQARYGDLPPSRFPPRPQGQLFARARNRVWDAPAALSRSLDELCAKGGHTRFGVLLAVWLVLLRETTGETDLGAEVLASLHEPETRSTFGNFGTTLLLRVRLEDDPSFAQVIRLVQEALLESKEHRDLPYWRVFPAERVDVLVNFLWIPAGSEAASELRIERIPSAGFTATRVAVAMYWRAFESPSGLDGLLIYDEGRVTQATAEALVKRYGELLAAALASPEIKISALAPR